MDTLNIKEIVAAAKAAAKAESEMDWAEDAVIEASFAVVDHKSTTWERTAKVVNSRKAFEEAKKRLLEACHGDVTMAKEVSGIEF